MISFPFFQKKRKTLGEILPLFIKSRNDLDLRGMTLVNYDVFSKRIQKEMAEADREADSFTRDDVREIAEKKSRRFAEELLTLLRWARSERLIKLDVDAEWGKPVLPRLPRDKGDRVCFFKPHEAHAFYLATSEAYRPAFALALFAGIRPYEVCRMRWDYIHVKERYIMLPPDVAKTGYKRIIEGVPTILWAQLALYQRDSGEIIPRLSKGKAPESLNVPRWIHERREAAMRASVTLGHDILRHTFATYFVALRGDPGPAVKVMGHCSLRLLAKHYDGVATRAEAEAFFSPPRRLALPCGS